MQNRKNMFIALTGILLLSFCSCSQDSDSGQKENGRQAAVRIVKAFKGDILTQINATGTIAPARESYLGPKVGGRIEGFFADEGDFVEKKSPLVSLEPLRFKLALKEAEAAFRESRAHQKNLESKLKRHEELFERGIINREALDDITTEMELASARADIAGVHLENASEDMADSVLYAPFSGYVVERKMNTGEAFSALSNDFVFHVVDTSTVKVELYIFETKKQYIKTGENVLVTVDAVPEKVFSGKITVVNPFVDSASRKFLVKIEIANPDFMLETGMFARVAIPEKQRTNVLLVPSSAVLEREDKQVLFVAEENAAAIKTISTGVVTHEFMEILSGIKEGDAVIVDGLYAVRDGTTLLIQE